MPRWLLWGFVAIGAIGFAVMLRSRPPSWGVDGDLQLMLFPAGFDRSADGAEQPTPSFRVGKHR
jgi:hypothetical protein